MWLSVTMPPFLFSVRPAEAARALLGVTPMERMTMSASTEPLSPSSTRTPDGVSSKPVTPEERCSSTPFSLMFWCSSWAISKSRGGMT